jgi:hypothetical protein
MNLKDRNEFVRKMFDEKCMKILEAKGHDYSHGGEIDANRNIKTVAKLLDVSPKLVWAIYFWKHLDAILGWVKGTELRSESLDDRMTDAINYLFILASLVEDEKTSVKDTEVKGQISMAELAIVLQDCFKYENPNPLAKYLESKIPDLKIVF